MADLELTTAIRGLDESLRGLGQLEASIAAIGATSASIASRLDGVGRSLQVLGGVLTAGLTAPLAAVTRTIIGATAQLQRIEVTIGAVSRSTAEGKRNFELVRDVALRFGYDMEALGRAYANFLGYTKSSNLSLQDQQAVFLAVAKAAVATNLEHERLMRVMTALGQVVAKGTKPYMEELVQQLAENLPGALGIAAEQLFKGENAVGRFFDAVKDGSITTDQALKAIVVGLDATFGEGALQQAEKYAASVGRVGTAWQLFAQSIGSGILPFLTQLNNMVAATLLQLVGLDPEVRRIAIGFGAFAAAVGPILVVLGTLTRLLAGISPITIGLSVAFAALGGAAFAMGERLAAAMDGATRYAVELFKAWDGSLSGLAVLVERVGGDVTVAFSGMMGAVAKEVGGLGPLVADALKNVAGAFDGFFGTDVLAVVTKAIATWPSSVVAALAYVTGAVIGWTVQLGAELAEAFVGLAGDAWDGLARGVGGIDWSRAFDSFVEGIRDTLGPDVAAAVETTLSGLGTTLRTAFETAVAYAAPAWDLIEDGITAALDALPDAISGAASLGRSLYDAFEAAIAFAAPVWDSVVDDVLAALATLPNVVAGLRTAWDRSGAELAGFLVGAIAAGLVNLATTLGNALAAAWDKAVSLFAADGAGSFLAAVEGWVDRTVTGFLAGFGNGLTAGISQNAKDWFAGLPAQVDAAVKAQDRLFVDVGAWILQRLAAAVQSYDTSPWDKAGAVLGQAIRDGFDGFFADAAPQGLTGWLGKINKEIIGFEPMAESGAERIYLAIKGWVVDKWDELEEAQGLQGYLATLTRLVASEAVAIADEAERLFDDAKAWLADAWAKIQDQGLAAYLDDLLGTLDEKAVGIAGAAQGLFEDAKAWLADEWAEIEDQGLAAYLDGLLRAVGEHAGELAAAAQGLFEDVKSWLADPWDTIEDRGLAGYLEGLAGALRTASAEIEAGAEAIHDAVKDWLVDKLDAAFQAMPGWLKRFIGYFDEARPQVQEKLTGLATSIITSASAAGTGAGEALAGGFDDAIFGSAGGDSLPGTIAEVEGYVAQMATTVTAEAEKGAAGVKNAFATLSVDLKGSFSSIVGAAVPELQRLVDEMRAKAEAGKATMVGEFSDLALAVGTEMGRIATTIANADLGLEQKGQQFVELQRLIQAFGAEGTIAMGKLKAAVADWATAAVRDIDTSKASFQEIGAKVDELVPVLEDLGVTGEAAMAKVAEATSKAGAAVAEVRIREVLDDWTLGWEEQVRQLEAFQAAAVQALGPEGAQGAVEAFDRAQQELVANGVLDELDQGLDGITLTVRDQIAAYEAARAVAEGYGTDGQLAVKKINDELEILRQRLATSRDWFLGIREGLGEIEAAFLDFNAIAQETTATVFRDLQGAIRQTILTGKVEIGDLGLYMKTAFADVASQIVTGTLASLTRSIVDSAAQAALSWSGVTSTLQTLVPGFGAVGTAAQGAGAATSAAAGGMLAALGPIAAAVAAIAAAFVLLELAGVDTLGAIGSALREVYQLFQPLIGAILDFGRAIGELVNANLRVMAAIFQALRPILEPIVAVFAGLLQVLTFVIDAMASLGNAFSSVGNLARVAFAPVLLLFQAIKAVIDLVAGAFGGLGNVASSVGGIIRAVLAPVLLLLQGLKALIDLVAGAFGALGNAASSALNLIGGAARLLFAGLTAGFNAFFALGRLAFAGLQAVATAALDAIAGVGRLVFGVLGGLLNAFLALGRGVFAAFQGVASLAFDAVAAVGRAAFAVLGGLLNAFLALARGAFAALQAAASAAFDAIGAVARTVVGAVSGLLNGLGSLGRSVFAAVQSAGTTAFNTIGSVARSVISSVSSLLSGLAGTASRVFSGIISGARNVASQVGSILGGLGGSLGDIAKLPGTIKDWVGSIGDELGGGDLDDLKDALGKIGFGGIDLKDFLKGDLFKDILGGIDFDFDFDLGDIFGGIFHQGGVVAGKAREVPILAEPGEFVVNRKAAKAYGPVLEAINANRLRFFDAAEAMARIYRGDRHDRTFGTGGSFIATGPTSVLVGEQGPEAFEARPLNQGGLRRGEGKVIINGPVFTSDVTAKGLMRRLGRELEREGRRLVV